MRLGRLYDLVIKYGIKNDPRGKSINDYFTKVKKEYNKLKGQERKRFDKESFRNPFADTRILYGKPDTEIRKILVGVDMEAPEILLADKIREREGLDLVLAHHPEGKAYAALSEVMQVQSFILEKLGLKKEIAEELMKERMSEVARKVSAANHTRSNDVARLLDMPFMCCHTPADNHVAKYLQALMDKQKPRKVNDVAGLLCKIPEYQYGIECKAGPKIILGKPEDKAGKVFVDMTGGTEGSKELFGRLSQAGVGTIVCMHLSEEHFAKAKPEHINVVIAGHIASDNLGLNLILDNIESEENLDILCCSGFKRIRR